MKKINQDEGYCYGLGVFETMAIVKGQIVFPQRHLLRLRSGLKELGIEVSGITRHFQSGPDEGEMEYGVKKVMVSEGNVIVERSQNPYQNEDYERGFRLAVSPVVRNETSPLTYIKSLNYGDNIMEKRRMKKLGVDEPVFLNSQGELTEGAVTNIFLCKDDVIYTPSVSCGLLPGIMRQWIAEHFPVKEATIRGEDISLFDEVFVTNSLLGIMPAAGIGEVKFSSRKFSEKLNEQYRKTVDLHLL